MFHSYIYPLTCIVWKLKKSCMGVRQYESKSINITSIRYSPMYNHHFTSNPKVRCKRRQVICHSLTYAPSKSNCNSITPCVLHVIFEMPKVMNQFGLFCNNICSWQLNDLLGCPWLTQLGGGTVIGRQSCAKSVWHTQALFLWYGCNQIIKLKIIVMHLYCLLATTL